MKYHNITTDDMTNGDGLRVVLWISGCPHRCEGCQNPITWNPDDGLEFDMEAKKEIYEQLDKDYISGITFSGGDPLYLNNIDIVWDLCEEIKGRYKNKTIWIYTGYQWENILSWYNTDFLKYVDILVDGRFVKELADVNYQWAGSTNQRVIDVKKSLELGKVVLWK